MSRYRVDEARIIIWSEGGRYCFLWRSARYWRDIHSSLRAYFPTHAKLSYSHARRVWSIPLTQRTALECWLAWSFEPGVVEWRDDPPSRRRYCDASGRIA